MVRLEQIKPFFSALLRNDVKYQKLIVKEYIQRKQDS
jgi:hypothetical protein